MNTKQLAEKAIAALDRLAATVTTTAAAGEIACIRECVKDLAGDDPQAHANRLLAKLGARLEAIMEEGVQCIGADGLPLYDDGVAVRRDANKGELAEVRAYIDKHGGFKKALGDDNESTAQERADAMRRLGMKKRVEKDDYDPRDDDDE